MKSKLTLFLLTLFLACIQSKNQNSENNVQPIDELAMDTLNADDFDLVFFHPNEEEFDELLAELGEDSGLYEVDSDYAYYANIVFDSLSKTDLKIRVASERIIKIRTSTGIKYLDRLKNEEHPYGIVLNKESCLPKIEFGVITDVGFYQLWSEYRFNCR